jgi:uncharacterized protein (TIGR03083 family)
MPRPLEPLITAHLFPTLDARLINLLRALTHDDWERPTIAPGWTIKDVAAHLLDTQLRRLSFGRDGYTPSPPPAIASDRDLVAFINRLNAEGVAVYRRLSPPVLIGWMEQTSREAASYYASLDPLAPAPIGVSWAGESVSANWFDIARELTERWHHQQQIRLALADSTDAAADASARAARSVHAIMTPELYHPVLDCFMRALPFHYRSISAPPGTVIRVSVTGDCGGDWHLYRAAAWVLTTEVVDAIAAAVTIPQDIAWRIFTKGIARDAAREHVHVIGDEALGLHALSTLAIVGNNENRRTE